MCSQLCSVQGGAHSCRPPFSNQAINLTSSRLETSSASTLGTFEGRSSRGPPSVTPPGMRPPLYRAGSARGPARGVCSMTVTCTHSAAPCPVSGQLDEDPNFWDGDSGVGVSPAEFHSHQLRAGVDRTEVSGSGAGPPPGGWSARGLWGSRLPPPQESREAYTRLGVSPLELQNPGGSLDKAQGRVPAEARTWAFSVVPRPYLLTAGISAGAGGSLPATYCTWRPHLVYSFYLFLLCGTKYLRQCLAKNVMTDGGDKSTVFAGCSLFK